MTSALSYIRSILNRGGKIIITNYIKLYDENGNFVCCLSEADYNTIRSK